MSEAQFPIYLDFPVNPQPRYGWGKPAHPRLAALLNQGRERYRATLESFQDYQRQLEAIAKHPDPAQASAPAWINGALPGLDALALYGFIATQKPARYFEVGVGNSTRFAHRAIQDHGLNTRIVAVDIGPQPGVEEICDEFILAPLEHLDLSLFDQLQAGDILFIDNSHRIFMNSDATVVFLDLLPRLNPGVLVEIHDICLPFDYPQGVKPLHNVLICKNQRILIYGAT